MGKCKRPTEKKSPKVIFRRFHKNIVMVGLTCISRFNEHINTNVWGSLT